MKSIATVSVLLVDAHPTLLRIVTRFLRDYHYREVIVVGTACSGEEALAQAQELRPEVILLSLHLPGLSGLQTISRLRNMLPEVGIIAMALMGADTFRRPALTAGADAFVVKSRLITDLMPAIQEVAQTSRLRAHSGRS